jgi:hypothetical protein
MLSVHEAHADVREPGQAGAINETCEHTGWMHIDDKVGHVAPVLCTSRSSWYPNDHAYNWYSALR